MSTTIKKCTWIEEGYGYDASGLGIIFNKIARGAGRRVFARIAGSGARLYVFTRGKDLAQTATVTDSVTWTNPTYDRDWDDATQAYVSLAANTARTTLRTYDIGAVKNVLLHLRYQSDASYVYIYLAVSSDGATWTDVYSGFSTTAVSLFFKVTARYFRVDGANQTTSAYKLYVNSFEIFDTANYDQMVESAGHPVELEVSPADQKVTVWHDCPNLCDWQIYTVRCARLASLSMLEVA